MARSQNEAAAPAGEAPTGVNRRVGWWALLFFLGCYLLTFSGRPGGGDQLTMYEMTRSLAERGALDLDPTAQGWLKAGRGGRFYSPYPPGQPLLAVPLYWLGEAAAWAKPGLDPGQATSFTVTLLAPIAAAAGLAAIYAILIQLGYRRRTAFAVAAIVGFGSFYWPLSKNFNSEPAAVALGRMVLVSLPGLAPTVGGRSLRGVHCVFRSDTPGLRPRGGSIVPLCPLPHGWAPGPA